MVWKRVLAVLVAVGLVAGAWVLRERLQGDDGTGSANGDGGQDEPGSSDVVWCVTELAEPCALLEEAGFQVEVGDAGTQFAALTAATAPDPDPVAWVTVYPWPELVDAQRARANLDPRFPDRPALASSPLVLVGPTERVAALAAACGGTLGWRCLGEQAGTPWADIPGGNPAWQDVKPAHASPVADALGLPVVGQLTADWWAGEQPPVAAADINPADFDGPFGDWFTRLERAVPRTAFAGTQSPLQTLLTGIPAFDVVGTTQAEAGSAPAERFTVVTPSPGASANVVVASAGDDPLGASARQKLAQALEGAGWTAPSPTPEGGLPSPVVHEALQLRWEDAT